MAYSRLIKTAKKLNVGVVEITKHLNNSGFDVECKPSAPITENMEQSFIHRDNPEVKRLLSLLKASNSLNSRLYTRISDLQEELRDGEDMY